MLRVHKIRLEPTRKQAEYFSKACGVSRFAYNWALAKWERLYEAGEKVSEGSLRKELNSIKHDEFPWMLEVTKNAPQQAIKNLGLSYQHFFRRYKLYQVGKIKKKEIGYPKFKKKGQGDSFRPDNGCGDIEVEGKAVRLPKIGWVKISEELRFNGKIKSGTISRIADKWFIALTIDTPFAPSENQTGIIGVDLGVSKFATLSNGQEIEGARALKALAKRLKRLQRNFSRKKIGSSKRLKARIQLAKLHAEIANKRIDVIHKLTTYLATNFKKIAIEDLNVQGMLKNHKLAKHISDQSFYEFRRQLLYKAEMYGSQVIVADRWFPSTKKCSNCGVIHDMPLSKRIIECECGFKAGRDLNAALNLESLCTVSCTES